MYLEIMKKKKKDYLGNFELSNTETVWWPKKNLMRLLNTI